MDKDELAKISRRLDVLQHSVDTFSNDRNMLEDLLTRMSAVEQALNLNKIHQTETTKDIKAEIREAGAIVENKVNDVLDTMDKKTILVKSKTTGLLEKIKIKIEGVKK